MVRVGRDLYCFVTGLFGFIGIRENVAGMEHMISCVSSGSLGVWELKKIHYVEQIDKGISLITVCTFH